MHVANIHGACRTRACRACESRAGPRKDADARRDRKEAISLPEEKRFRGQRGHLPLCDADTRSDFRADSIFVPMSTNDSPRQPIDCVSHARACASQSVWRRTDQRLRATRHWSPTCHALILSHTHAHADAHKHANSHAHRARVALACRIPSVCRSDAPPVAMTGVSCVCVCVCARARVCVCLCVCVCV